VAAKFRFEPCASCCDCPSCPEGWQGDNWWCIGGAPPELLLRVSGIEVGDCGSSDCDIFNDDFLVPMDPWAVTHPCSRPDWTWYSDPFEWCGWPGLQMCVAFFIDANQPYQMPNCIRLWASVGVVGAFYKWVWCVQGVTAWQSDRFDCLGWDGLTIPLTLMAESPYCVLGESAQMEIFQAPP